ncbi:MAG: hypothetical protein AAFR79_13550 [Pseudomonadota bacterium]
MGLCQCALPLSLPLGRHTRLAIGVMAMPDDVVVEVEGVFAV